MNGFERKEPYFHIKIEGDYTNWAAAGFPGLGLNHDKAEVWCECKTEDELTVQKTYVKNISDQPIVLNHVSSMLVNGIGTVNDGDYAVYICRSSWQGEMQWSAHTLQELGIYDASNHVNVSSAKISFNGSQTTSEAYPMLMIEDKKSGLMWYFEIEPASGWYFEVGIMENSLYVEANSAFICNDGWNKKLEPGEIYDTAKAWFGCVKGGFSEAVAVITKYKRDNWQSNIKVPYVIFNDYMNCLWAKPAREKLLPLIDAAAEAGCEVFCIDDGWYEKGKGGEHLGDWQPADERFGSYGFKGITEYIQSRNMIPGVWLEMECCSEGSETYKKLNDSLLRRNGCIIGGGRAFLDFRKADVREYTRQSVDSLYKSGVRYIKNDYNHNIMIGCDGAESLSEGYAAHRKAFLRFIDDIRGEYPDLIVESCSSGAMRADYGFIKHMDLQSASDQELYYNNPAIAAGTLSYMPPERCGFWAYPYPLKYEEQPEGAACKELNINGNAEETVFNMINSMLGVIYLSGHIEFCNKQNMELIKEAIRLYKTYRDCIAESYPVYLTKPLRINENGVMAIGLKMKRGILAAIWKVNSDNYLISVEVPEHYKTAKLIYPKTMDPEFRIIDHRLDVLMKAKNCARLFWIE